jgi:CBS domain-containing protein
MSKPRLVADVMTRDPVTLHEEDSLAGAASTFLDRRIRHLPVVDGRRLVGLVTERDLLRVSGSALSREPVAAVREARRREETFIAAVMRRDVETVSPATRVADAARCLAEQRIGCLPVVDHGELVGIVTETDLLRELAAALDREERRPARSRDQAA